ncbi:MAG: hypothetical protein HY755_10635 [Nitrospirae bacterium]|nr:hypothetical protein [Nitrospirota bacterium]
MSSKRRGSENFICSVLVKVFFMCLLFVAMLPLRANAKTGIINTKHNLSVTGLGEIKALTETRICVFCHTPHNAEPATPLWNKKLEARNYDPYASTTIHVSPSQPTGPSRLCLSCHDGTIALGAVRNPAGGIATTREITPDRLSYIGTFLKDDHPISFPYNSSVLLAPLEFVSPPLTGLMFYGSENTIHCSTCHDVHDNTHGKFLVKSNQYSALCTSCHIKDGWTLTTHRTAISIVSTALPVSPRDWPTWLTVSEWGCEGCHTPHSAKGQQRLFYYNSEEENCYTCHKGNVAQKNIYSQFQKLSRHPVELTTIGVTANYHDPKESALITNRHVECVDCHNSHASNARTASAPYASGRLEKVRGININSTEVFPVTYEYEICFRCHADSASQFPFIPRVINETNARLEFDLNNPSYHPVVGIGKNTNVPSIPSLDMPLTTTSVIYCKDCHESDESSAIGGTGPRGPHGSIYAPILRERYETVIGTIEGRQNYALCYRCHNQTSILNDDSFKKNILAGKGGHSGHLGAAVNAPCSVCHDSHGVKTDVLSGDHTHLINFDTRIVTPVTGNTYPIFTDAGVFSGNCTLECHLSDGSVKIHNNVSYP